MDGYCREIRLKWNELLFFLIFDGISIGYVEIISRYVVGVILNDRAGVFGRFRAGVLGNVFLSAIKMFWNWKIHDSIQNDSKFWFWRQFAEKCIFMKIYAARQLIYKLYVYDNLYISYTYTSF